MDDQILPAEWLLKAFENRKRNFFILHEKFELLKYKYFFDNKNFSF